nr:copper homeostasis protein CutC [Sphingomonas melonis]
MGRSRVALEICVESAVGAAAAIAGGCDRIELCSALALGGLTPSAGLVAEVLALAVPAGVPVRAIVRPRAGGFDYDAEDMVLALAEARALVAAGVQGLVFGATAGGKLAEREMRAWIAGLGEDRPPLTLHRAIDVVADPVAAVDVAVSLGFDHVLTSGGARTAMEGGRRRSRRWLRARRGVARSWRGGGGGGRHGRPAAGCDQCGRAARLGQRSCADSGAGPLRLRSAAAPDQCQ